MDIKELENKIKELQEELNKLKEEKKITKRWKSEDNEEYFLIRENGDIQEELDTNTDYDNEVYELGNYFKTEEQAEKEKERRIIYQELKDLSLELNNGEKIDWKDKTRAKISIYKDGYNNKLCASLTYGTRELGQIYCIDKNFMDIAIDRIGEERLLKLFEEEQ